MRESKNWNLKSVILACALCISVSGTALAQQRPLVTEDPETIGSGRILLEGGFSLDTDQAFPANAVEGDVARLASFGVSVGVSPIVELQVDGGLIQRLNVTARAVIPPAAVPRETDSQTSSVEDFVVATKI